MKDNMLVVDVEWAKDTIVPKGMAKRLGTRPWTQHSAVFQHFYMEIQEGDTEVIKFFKEKPVVGILKNLKTGKVYMGEYRNLEDAKKFTERKLKSKISRNE